MQTEALEREGIDGTAAGTAKSAAGGIADVFTADGLMDTSAVYDCMRLIGENSEGFLGPVNGYKEGNCICIFQE